MSFAYASASKGPWMVKRPFIRDRHPIRPELIPNTLHDTGLLLWTGFASLVVSTFGKKHYFHLQLVPHITKDHQLWRLVSRNLAFTSSVDLFVSVLLLYNTSIALERRFGTVKFISFAIVSSLFGTALETVALALGHTIGLEYLPAGPYTLVFSILYTFDKTVPASYIFKLFGFSFSSKSLLYLLSLQLIFAQPPNSIVSAVCGLTAGALYRGNVLGSQQWRIPAWLQRLGGKGFSPLLASSRPSRRSARTSLEDSDGPSSARREEPTPRGSASARQGAISEVVQTFAGTRAAGAPSPEAVAQLQAMFPSATAEQVQSALQRGGNDINRSVEFLL